MKKTFTLLIVICVLLFACAGLNLNKSDTHTVEFGPNTYTLPSTIPDFASWEGQIDLMFISQKFVVVRWMGFSPKNEDEAVMLLIAGEDFGKEESRPYLMVLVHVQSIELDKHSFYADKEYVQTGKPSFILSFISDPPDIEKFIAMKEQQLTPKVET